VSEPFHMVHSIWCERANERIAELEAELARCQEIRDEYHRLAMEGPNTQMLAELAALNARRCEGCKNFLWSKIQRIRYCDSEVVSGMCSSPPFSPMREFWCSEWEARAEEGAP
jgi:hypothetical protein